MTPDERALLAEILRCDRCGLALEEHEVYFVPPKITPPLAEAVFPAFETAGLYCPQST